MIEDNIILRKEQKREPTEEERKQVRQTIEYLDALPYRPFGIDW